MGDELKGFEETAPTLTLEPDLGEAKPAAPAVPEAEAVKKEMEQTILTPEEQQMVDSFAHSPLPWHSGSSYSRSCFPAF